MSDDSTPKAPLYGVILAAGKGLRLKPFTEGLPKPLLPVRDQPLLERQILALRDLGVREILIVIGHLGHHIAQRFGDGSSLGLRIEYVEQEETLGIAHALAQAADRIRGPFMLFLGDIYFETRDLSTMVEQFQRNDVDGVLAVKVEENVAALRRNFSIEVAESGFVERVVEKPRHPRGKLKGCGLYVFDDAIFEAIACTPRSALRDEYELTHAIQGFIDRGARLVPAHVVEQDLNLSVPRDLLELNLYELRGSGEANYIAETASVDPGAKLEGSVVMSGARVGAGVRLDRCVVLPGERVESGEHERTIFAFGGLVACP